MSKARPGWITPKTEIGVELRRWRKSLGLAQVDMAARCGIAPSSIKAYETTARTPHRSTRERTERNIGKRLSAPLRCQCTHAGCCK